MGTNCAVFVANLFCYTYEFDFVQQLIDANEIELLRHFRFTARFIDDLLSCNNPVFERYIYRTNEIDGIRGIYPDFLRLNCEQNSTGKGKVSFLDLTVNFDGDNWFTRTYDKREHPPLSRVNLVRYPHPSCFLSDRSKYGIITSRMHCFGRVCQRRADFIHRARLFLREFQARSYSAREVRRYVVRFLRRVPLQFHVRDAVRFARRLMAR